MKKAHFTEYEVILLSQGKVRDLKILFSILKMT